jgi:hypothetical protein
MPTVAVGMVFLKNSVTTLVTCVAMALQPPS